MSARNQGIDTGADRMSDAERDSVFEAARLVDEARRLLERASGLSAADDDINCAICCLPDTESMRRRAEQEHAE